MVLEFNYERSLEAAACLLRLHGGSMNYMRLIKLLYIAERELLAETATPLTGDCYKAMDNGPVLSTVYDHIMEKHWTNPDWHTYVKKIPNFKVTLAKDPGGDHLPKIVTDKLVQVTEKHKDKNHWDLVKLTHEFPEWIKNKPAQGSSNLIPLEDILEAMGEGPETLNAIMEDELERQRMNQLFDELHFEQSAEGAPAR
jgi:uncharacterized phage-associated protein